MLWVRRRKTGFTLVELLIVIVIIGILAGMMMFATGAATDKAQATKIVNNMRTLKSAVLMYYMDNYKWPDGGSDTANNKGIDASVLRGYVDQSKFTDSIGGTYSIIKRSTVNDKSRTDDANVYVGSVFIRYQNTNMSTGLKEQLALMAPSANLWNSSEFGSWTPQSGSTDDRFGYYTGLDYGNKGKQSQTLHLPVYINKN